MSDYISIIGIDGCGKSTIIPILVNLIAARLELEVVAVGDDTWGMAPGEDWIRPGFKPDGESLTGRLARLCRRLAKSMTAHRRLYPPIKLMHLALQERMVHQLADKYHPDILISDGNLLLSAAGRAMNYAARKPPPEEGADRLAPLLTVEALYGYIFNKQPLPSQLSTIAGLTWMRWLHWLDNRLNMSLLQLPDELIFLDVTPEVALGRLQAKGQRLDPHENLADLAEARSLYQGVVEFFSRHRGREKLAVIDTTQMSVDQAVAAIVAALGRWRFGRQEETGPQGYIGHADQALTKTTTILRKALNFRYLARYLLPHLHHGSARELTFPLSRMGRMLLRQGYSAGVMRHIYEQQPGSRLEQIFLDYPLHQAVYRRLTGLQGRLGAEVCRRLAQPIDDGRLCVLTAPSGYAVDLFGTLKRLAEGGWPLENRIEVTAADMDPGRNIEAWLRSEASDLGFTFNFIQGDMTSARLWARLGQGQPYDIVLFIGLSCWMAKPHLLRYLAWIRQHLLAPGGILFADCFTPGAFALSGKYLGYKANYYSPTQFTHLLAFCGFETDGISWESEPGGINHIFVVRHLASRGSHRSYESAALGQPGPSSQQLEPVQPDQ